MKRIILALVALLALASGPAFAQGTQIRMQVNLQTGTSYTIANADCGKNVVVSNVSAIAITLPRATPSFLLNCALQISAGSTGTITVTPTTSVINRATTLTLTAGQAALITSTATATANGDYVALKGN